MELPVELNLDQPRVTIRMSQGDSVHLRITMNTDGKPVDLIRLTWRLKEECEVWSESVPWGKADVKTLGLLHRMVWRLDKPESFNRCVYECFLRPMVMENRNRRLTIGLSDVWMGTEVKSNRWKV